MKNYYEILNVDKSAELREIKRAYAKLVRQYSPETHPEEFKEIRKAYEVLSDASSREAFDKSLERQELGGIQYKFSSDSHANNQETEPVINIKLNPPVKQRPFSSYAGKFDEDGPAVTPESNYDEVLKLSNINIRLKNYDKAIEILNAAIDKANPDNSKNILYYIELIKLFCIKGDLKQVSEVVDIFFGSIKLDINHNALNYIFSKLKTLSYDMFKEKKYIYSKTLLLKMSYIDPESTDIKLRLRPLYSIDECKGRLYKIYNDRLIAPCIKDLIALWLDEEMDEQKKVARLVEIKIQISNTDKLSLCKSLKQLRNHYKSFYHIDFHYFEELQRSINKSSPLLFLVSATTPGVSYIILLLVFSLACSMASLNSFKAHNTGSETSVSEYMLPPDTKLPSILPAGFVIEEGYVKYKKDGALVKLPDISTDEPVDANKLLKNIYYLKLVMSKNNFKVNYEVSVSDNSAISDMQGKEIQIVQTKSGLGNYMESNGKKKLIISRPLITEDIIKKSNGITPYFLNYEITTDSFNDIHASDLYSIAEGLK